MVATFKFSKKDAKRSMNLSYYSAQSKNMKDYTYMEKEKFRLSTKKWDLVTNILEHYKSRGKDEFSTTGKILKGIYEKNKLMAQKRIPLQKTTNVLPLIARTETLLLAYKRIKGNRGALSKAADVDLQTLRSYNSLQRSIYYRKRIFPDGFSLRDLDIVSTLILKGKYPCRRIWLDKPGDPTKKRPITIPPFLDRIVQEATKMVLYAVWEPDFERVNRSFGFRPNKSCHDAIAALKSNYTIGLYTAIEGDIQGAYDNVDKNILLEQLARKIQDKKFLQFMSMRLKYDFVDETNKTRAKPVDGIPQGGIESPYLFNIYLHDLDIYVKKELVKYLNDLNKAANIPKNKVGKPCNTRGRLKSLTDRRLKKLKSIKEKQKSTCPIQEVKVLRKELFKSINEIRIMNHRLRKMAYYDKDKRKLRLFYIRYADDWIILTNTNVHIATKMKESIGTFLKTYLKATLSEKKTLITDIRKEAANFLGFELRRYPVGRLVYVKGKLIRASGLPIIVTPDTQRLINRLYSHGFCNKKGTPICMPWIANFETQVIIQRYNASMIGLMQYYAGWVHSISTMRRWIYIMRFSCLKTLARKHKSTISKIFKRFGTDLYEKSTATIQASIEVKIGDVVYEKYWKLLTFSELTNKYHKFTKVKQLKAIFTSREGGEIGEYPLNSSVPVVTHENFLEAILNENPSRFRHAMRHRRHIPGSRNASY